PEFDYNNLIRQRTGSSLPGIVPSNTYPCNDDKYIVIGGNGDSIFKRLMTAIGRDDIAKDEQYATNDLRAKHGDFLDGVITQWTKEHTLEEANSILDDYDVPNGPIYDVSDMMEDPHIQYRKMIETVQVDQLGSLKMPGIMPKFSETPGSIKWPGPKLGEHNEEVYKGLLQFTEEKIEELQNDGII